VVVINTPVAMPLRNRFTGDTKELDTANGRLPYFNAGIDYLKSASIQPLLIGGGTGWNFQVVGNTFGEVLNIHNAFLHVAIDHGLIGLILFMLIIYYGVRSLRMTSGVVKMSSLCGMVFLLICCFSLSPVMKPHCWLAFGLFVCRPAVLGKLVADDT
jgi:hypothetical protein